MGTWNQKICDENIRVQSYYHYLGLTQKKQVMTKKNIARNNYHTRGRRLGQNQVHHKTAAVTLTAVVETYLVSSPC